MKYCKHCGNQIEDDAVICPSCGVAQEKLTSADSGSIGYGILGFLFPIIGLILFIAWNSSKPNSAKAAGYGTLSAVVFWILFWIFLGGIF